MEKQNRIEKGGKNKMGRIINLFTICDNSCHKKSEKEGGVRKMRKYLLMGLICFMMLCVSAETHAGISLYYDMSSIDGSLGITDIFDRQVTTTIDATSTYALGMFPGAPFSDIGDLQVGSMTFSGVAIGNDQNLNSSWELTGRWANLMGNLTSISPIVGSMNYGITYTSGTVNLYAGLASDSPSTVNANFGSGVGSEDDVASTFTDGTLIATLSLTSGYGALDDYNNTLRPDGGFTFTTWKIMDVPTGLWFDPAGNDLETLLEAYGYAQVNTLVAANVTIVGGGFPGSKIHSRNTGDINYVVPEPTSLLLLGSGLLGLAGAGFRRRKRIA